MCGITGFVDFNNRTEKEVLVRMTAALHHRGPDDSGLEIINTSNATVGFGFRRLAILDLSPAGHQPMFDPITGNWIVFNGEIYNFKEIRSILEKEGSVFRSNSDTEVILCSYRKWGINCVDHFIGMFSICIYDANSNRLICFRDRAGVKPFYFYWDGSLFLFASELKAICEHPSFNRVIDDYSLSLYFEHGYIPAPFSVFKDTQKLEPGHLLEIDLKSKNIERKQYWNVEDYYKLSKLDISEEEAINHLEELFVSAFNYRMISDVPVGLFLSGGYDSSCVAAILKSSNHYSVNSFTIGFEEDLYNESDHARAVANHLVLNHHELICSQSDAIEIIPRLPMVFDEPFADQSAIPTVLVSKIAREHVTVALSADGGDELFAGYPRHRRSLAALGKINSLNWMLRPLALSGLLRSKPGHLVKPHLPSKLQDILLSSSYIEKFSSYNRTFSLGEIKSLLIESKSPKYLNTTSEEGINELDLILLSEFKGYLSDDILHKVDRATMSVSLEGREPMIDHRIVQFVAQLPVSFKCRLGEQKYILKKLVHKYIPESIMNRPKMGFGVPLEQWCNNELRSYFYNTLDAKKLKDQGIIDYSLVSEMLNAYDKGKLTNFQRLWSIFTFQSWYDKWIQ